MSDSVRFVLFVTSQRAGAAVSGCDSGRRGVAAPGGCRRTSISSCVCAAGAPVAPEVGAVSVAGATKAQALGTAVVQFTTVQFTTIQFTLHPYL